MTVTLGLFTAAFTRATKAVRSAGERDERSKHSSCSPSFPQECETNGGTLASDRNIVPSRPEAAWSVPFPGLMNVTTRMFFRPMALCCGAWTSGADATGGSGTGGATDAVGVLAGAAGLAGRRCGTRLLRLAIRATLPSALHRAQMLVSAT